MNLVKVNNQEDSKQDENLLELENKRHYIIIDDYTYCRRGIITFMCFFLKAEGREKSS